MSSKPLVSVVIPTYNRAGSICATVGNILSQTYPFIELIVVDDGSCDDTLKRLQIFGNKVKVISQPNAGPAAARNRGAIASQGEILAFQDSDDLWKPTKLDRQVRILQQVDRSVPCCLCNAARTVGEREVSSTFADARLKPETEEGVWLNVAEVLATRFVLFNQAAAIRREAWSATGGYNPKLKYLEDYDLPLRLALMGPWAFIREPLVIYRQGSSHSFSKQGQSDKICLKQCEIQIFESILDKLKDDASYANVRRQLTRRLGRFRRGLRATTLAGTGSGLLQKVGSLLNETERYRNAFFTRSPWFPRMKTVPIGTLDSLEWPYTSLTGVNRSLINAS